MNVFGMPFELFVILFLLPFHPTQSCVCTYDLCITRCPSNKCGARVIAREQISIFKLFPLRISNAFNAFTEADADSNRMKLIIKTSFQNIQKFYQFIVASIETHVQSKILIDFDIIAEIHGRCDCVHAVEMWKRTDRNGINAADESVEGISHRNVVRTFLSLRCPVHRGKNQKYSFQLNAIMQNINPFLSRFSKVNFN